MIKTDEPQIKTEENFKKEKPKIGLCSYRLRESSVLSDLFNNILKMKEKNKSVGGVIYDNDIESNQAGIIYLGMALNFDYIILNGVNMSDQKITKIKGYVEELEILSNRKEEGDINEKENEEKKENKNENVQDKIKEDVINEEVASKKNSKIDVNKN
jgi:hypothetical protein